MQSEDSFVRETIFGLFITIGGFISMLTRLTNEALKAYQGFIIDKSLIKKIFSWKEPSKEKSKAFFKKSSEEYEFDKK